MDVPGEVELGPVVVDFSVEVEVSVVEVEVSVVEVEDAVEVKASVGVEELYVLDELEPKLEVEPEGCHPISQEGLVLGMSIYRNRKHRKNKHRKHQT